MDAEGAELVNIEQAIAPDPLAEAVRQIEQATAAKKCWSGGCLHNTLAVIDRGMPRRTPEREPTVRCCKRPDSSGRTKVRLPRMRGLPSRPGHQCTEPSEWGCWS